MSSSSFNPANNYGGILYGAVSMNVDEPAPIECNRSGSTTIKATCLTIFKTPGYRSGLGSRKSFQNQENMYNLQTLPGGILLLCVTHMQFPRSTAFYFLDAVQKIVQSKSGGAGGPADRKRLEDDVRRLTEQFSDPKNDKIGQLKASIEETNNRMIDNVDKVIERGEKIDRTVDQTAAMQRSAKDFQKGATEVKKAARSRSWWLCIGIVVLVIVAIFIIVLLACKKDGLNFKAC